MLCHFLIGIPASGKSTFAQLLAKIGNYQIISTDTIRQQLYGDENLQGNWLVWYLNLDVKIAQTWNSQRDRTVPDNAT